MVLGLRKLTQTFLNDFRTLFLFFFLYCSHIFIWYFVHWFTMSSYRSSSNCVSSWWILRNPRDLENIRWLGTGRGHVQYLQNPFLFVVLFLLWLIQGDTFQIKEKRFYLYKLLWPNSLFTETRCCCHLMSVQKHKSYRDWKLLCII